MPKGSLAAGVRLVVCVSTLLIVTAPSRAQMAGVFSRYDNTSRVWSPMSFPSLPPAPLPGSPLPGGMISADILRNPLPRRILAKLEKAMKPAQMGDHKSAIANLRAMLTQHPQASPYIHNLLGIEYATTHQVLEARDSFAETVRFMPHLSANHFNLGISLLDSGEADRAEQELRKAVELDPESQKAKEMLEALQSALRRAESSRTAKN